VLLARSRTRQLVGSKTLDPDRRHHIHILDDDSLLNAFHLYRLALVDEDDANDDPDPTLQGEGWSHQRWWHELARVCRRWRHLVIGSASYLRLFRLCTYGTRVEDVLAYSPPLPLVIDYMGGGNLPMAAGDEEVILFALRHRDRVRRIRLQIPFQNLPKVIATIGDEFPMLEYLHIAPPTRRNANLILPETFDAPRLGHLVLKRFDFPMRSPILTTAVGIVTLTLEFLLPSAHFRSLDFLQCLSNMSRLEKLTITLHSSIPDDDIEGQSFRVPIATHIVLHKLRWLGFKGTGACVGTLLPLIGAPLLEKLEIIFFDGLPSSMPYLLHIASPTENLRFGKAKVRFDEKYLVATAYLDNEAKLYTLGIQVVIGHFNSQVASAAQIFDTLRKLFSAVEYLILQHQRSVVSSRWDGQADQVHWHDLLRSLNSVKTLHVSGGLVRELSGALRILVEDGPGGPIVELLPRLKELSYSSRRDNGDGFASFVRARRNAGNPITLLRQGVRLVRERSWIMVHGEAQQ
jgi:hypothetical protein